MLANGITLKSSNDRLPSIRAATVPILKENGLLRICVDYRHINTITEKKYLMPDINGIFHRLSNAKVIYPSLSTGYYQVALEKSSGEKTAFMFENIKF